MQPALLVPLLALHFATPWMLGGLALAAAPLLIHLLSRRNHREMEWAAMRFLLEAIRKNSRRLMIEHLVLLGLRTLLLAALACALAQPSFEGLGPYFQPNQPVHRILVVDASYSMAYETGDESLFDRARRIAREVVSHGRTGDAYNLVRISTLPPTVIIETPSFQRSDVLAEIDQLHLPHGRGDVALALAKVEELLKAAPQLQKEVYVLSDFQRATWLSEGAAESRRVRESLKRLGDVARLTLLDVGRPEAANVAIVDLQPQEPFATTSHDLRLRANVRNFGRQPLVELPVQLLVDGRVREARRLSIDAGGEGSVEFSHRFEEPGEHRVEVRAERDALPLDDQRWLPVPVREHLRVLCVDGGGGAAHDTDYLELALSPDPEQPGAIRVRVVTEVELPGIDLEAYDCVFVCNVGLVTASEAELLEHFLQSGGGVVWCLGDRVQFNNYNDVLYRGGEGPLPARLVARRESRDPGFEFEPGDFTHPLFAAFRGNPDAGLETTRTFAYITAGLPAETRARVALRFDSGEPAVIEAPFGLGRSVLVTTSVDDRWGNWPVWPSFLPMIHELVHFAVAGRWGERQRLVGESLQRSLRGLADLNAAILRPDGQSVALAPTARGGLQHFEYDTTDISGIYEMTLGSPAARNELFAVNVDTRESDLTKLGQDELAGELLRGVEFRYQTEWEQPPPTLSDSRDDVGALTRWLLYLVLGLCLVELTLAWNFRMGLRLLALVGYVLVAGAVLEASRLPATVALLACWAPPAVAALAWWMMSRNRPVGRLAD